MLHKLLWLAMTSISFTHKFPLVISPKITQMQSFGELAMCPEKASQSYKLAVQIPSAVPSDAHHTGMLTVSQALQFHNEVEEGVQLRDQRFKAVQLQLLLDLRLPLIQIDLDLNYGQPIQETPREVLKDRDEHACSLHPTLDKVAKLVRELVSHLQHDGKYNRTYAGALVLGLLSIVIAKALQKAMIVEVIATETQICVAPHPCTVTEQELPGSGVSIANYLPACPSYDSAQSLEEPR